MVGGGALLALAGAAAAADRFWVAAGDGASFNDPLNWSPSGVPGGADSVLLDGTGGTITLASAFTLTQRLEARGATPAVTFALAGHLWQLSAAAPAGAGRSLLLAPQSADAVDVRVQDGTLLLVHGAVGEAGQAALRIDADATLNATGEIRVGESGDGLLHVEGLAIADALVLGGAGGGGEARATLAGSLLLSIGDTVVGDAGAGTLTVDAGGLAVTAGDAYVGRLPGSNGAATVDGAGSAWSTGGLLELAGDGAADGGSGQLLVTNGAAAGIGAGLTIRSQGQATVDAASLSAASLLVRGGSLLLANGGTAAVSSAGATPLPGLHVGLTGGPGSATLEAAGSVVAEDAFVGNEDGSDGTVIVREPGTTLLATGGVTVGGAGTGLLEVREHAQVTAGQLTLDAGGTLRVQGGQVTAGAMTVSDASTMVFPLSASDPAPRVDVAGTAALAGLMELTLLDGTPQVGDQYSLLTASVVDGTATVTTVPLFSEFRFLDVSVVPDGAGSRVEAAVKPLGIQLNVDAPTDDTLPAPPNQLVVDSFGADLVPDAAVTIPGGTRKDPSTVVVLTNTLPSAGSTPGYDVAAVVPVGPDPRGLQSGDFDGDGRTDLVVSTAGNARVTVIRNNGTALRGADFVVSQEIDLSSPGTGVGVGDIDGDRSPDLAVTQPLTGVVILLFNNGLGQFLSTTPVPAGSNPESVDPLDLDQDKDVDLVTMNAGLPGVDGDSTVTISVNLLAENGGVYSGFSAPVAYAVGEGPVALATGDLTGDGAPEVVTANAESGTISVLVNRGDGTFFPAIDLPAGGTPQAVVLADLDNDDAADLDVAVLVDAGGTPELTVYRNDTAGDFLALAPLFNAQTLFGIPAALAAGNADDDGPADLVTAGAAGGATDAAGGTISVLVAQPIVCTGSIDGNGVIDGADLGLLLASWGTNPGSPADLDGNGVVDSADLGILLGNWGPCQ